MVYSSIEELIGNTPLLKVDEQIHGLKHIELYAKLEYMNPFGSVKDRVAKGMLDPVLDDLVKTNKTILETSSGNTAKALCVLGSMHGLSYKTITNRIKHPEVRMILQTLGAQLEELPGLSYCPDPLDPNDFATVASNLAKAQPDVYHYTDQYFNERNINTHYATTGKEIVDDLGKVDYYFGFLGTCGSSMGVGRYLREQNPQAEIYGVVAAPGHHVPGGRNMNELWEVGFFQKDFFTNILSGTSDEAVNSMLELNRRSGILCGPTTGLSYYAAIQQLKVLDAQLEGSLEKRKAVFIACDRLEPYMSYVKQRRPELYSSISTERPTVNKLSEQEIAAGKVLSIEELQARLVENPLIIDLRGYFAFSIGHFANSFNMIDETFQRMIEEGSVLPRQKPIILVCASGTISKKFAAFLHLRYGYDAYSLEGGIIAWREAGLPLSKEESL